MIHNIRRHIIDADSPLFNHKLSKQCIIHLPSLIISKIKLVHQTLFAQYPINKPTPQFNRNLDTLKTIPHMRCGNLSNASIVLGIEILTAEPAHNSFLLLSYSLNKIFTNYNIILNMPNTIPVPHIFLQPF